MLNSIRFDGSAKFRILSLFTVVLLIAGAAIGQTSLSTGSIVGTVTDKQGAVVSGAKITLTQPSTGLVKESVSNESGLYSFPGLNVP